MAAPNLVMYEAEQKEIQAVIERLTHDSRAKACFVIDKNGIIQHIDVDKEALDPSGAGAACSVLEHKKSGGN